MENETKLLKRHRTHSRDRDHHDDSGRKDTDNSDDGRSGSNSSSSSDEEGSSEDSSSHHRKRSQLSQKHKKSENKSSKKKSKEKTKKKKDKASSKTKKKSKSKDKAKKRAKHSSSISASWGSHGIISESDYYSKEAEFRSWLVHVKKVSPEDRNSKSFFSEFVEDFNTGTLPHEKFYNIDAWDRREQSEQYLRGGSGSSLGNVVEFDFARDEQMLKQQHRARTRVPEVSTMTSEDLLELKRVQEERVTAEKLRKLGFKPKDSLGVRYDNKLLD